MIGDQREDAAAVPPAGDAGGERRRTTDGIPLDVLGTVLIPPQARPGAGPDGQPAASPPPAPAPAALRLGPVRPRAARQPGPVPERGEPHPAPVPQPAPPAEPPGAQPPPPPPPPRRHRPAGPAAAKRERESTLEIIRTPIRRCYRIAVLSLKGGAGTAPTALPLGATLAAERGDRVIALDADPETATLGRWLRPETGRSLGDLVAALPSLAGYPDIRAFTARTPSGLEVLAGDPNAAVSAAMTGRDYRRVMELLGGQYPVVITDSGTGLMPDLMSGILDCTDQLILATTPSAAGARSADAAMDWLSSHGYGELVRRGITVFSAVRETRPIIRTGDLVTHFETRTRGVVVIPFDEHLAAGTDLDVHRLQTRTRQAYLGLAAMALRGVPPQS